MSESLNIQIIAAIINTILQQNKERDDFFVKGLKTVTRELDQETIDKAQQTLQQLYKYVESECQIKINSSPAKQGSFTSFKQVAKVKRLYVDGCFDLMHSGHYNAIRQAKQLCQTLVVGVVSTEEIAKRKGIPVMNLEERMILAESCKWADEVVPNMPYDPTIELLDQLNCSHVAHGDDIIFKEDGSNVYSEFMDVGRFLMFKRTEGISSTDIVGRLLLMTKNQTDEPQQKALRKLSGEEGITVSQMFKQESLSEENKCQEIKNDKQKEEDLNQQKMLNTTKRIRQFSQDLKEPREGDKITYIDGSFDLLHIGHIQTLKQAKSKGDYLIVGVYDDELISKRKGSNYPILNLQERILNILAMKYVDEVIIGAPWKITDKMMKQFNIDLVCCGTKGESIQQIDDPYEIPKQQDKFLYIDSNSEMTSELFVDRIIQNRIEQQIFAPPPTPTQLIQKVISKIIQRNQKNKKCMQKKWKRFDFHCIYIKIFILNSIELFFNNIHFFCVWIFNWIQNLIQRRRYFFLH